MSIPEDHVQIGRLALRAEGKRWAAYYAKPDTMDDALFLGAIRMSIVQNSEKHKAAFMDLMREIVSDMIENVFGDRPTWDMHPAPEHERSGNA